MAIALNKSGPVIISVRKKTTSSSTCKPTNGDRTVSEAECRSEDAATSNSTSKPINEGQAISEAEDNGNALQSLCPEDSDEDDE